MNSNMPVPAQSGFNAMQTNIVVTMDDVVSAFVSKYETQLFERKKLLSAELTRTQAELKKLMEAVRAKIDTSAHDAEGFSIFNLVAEGKKEVHLDFAEGIASYNVVISVVGQNRPREQSYYGSRNELTVTVRTALDVLDVGTHGQLTKLIDATEKDLADVLDKIKSVARKEREVRGRIAMRKIEESGYASLLNDSQLAELVQL